MLCGELRKLIRWALSWWALAGTYALIGIASEDRETGRAGRLASSASERLCDVNRGRSADAGRDNMPLRSFLKIDGENGDSGSFENDPGPNGVETSLSFNFAKISVTDQPTTRHGIVGTPQTFAFDLSENKVAAAVSSDIASSDIVSSAGLPAASAAVPVPASSPLHYFLKIDDLKGDATVKGFEGWFSVDTTLGCRTRVHCRAVLVGALAKRSSRR